MLCLNNAELMQTIVGARMSSYSRHADVQPANPSHAEVGHHAERRGSYFRVLIEIKAKDKSLEI